MKKSKKIAILIVSALISIGLVVFGIYKYRDTYKAVVSDPPLSAEYYRELYDAWIKQYVGQVKGPGVKTIIRRTNKYNNDEGFSNTVKVIFDGNEPERREDGYIIPSISNILLFDVSAEYDEDGYVSKVIISSINDDTNAEENNSQIERAEVNENN